MRPLPSMASVVEFGERVILDAMASSFLPSMPDLRRKPLNP